MVGVDGVTKTKSKRQDAGRGEFGVMHGNEGERNKKHNVEQEKCTDDEDDFTQETFFGDGIGGWNGS